MEKNIIECKTKQNEEVLQSKQSKISSELLNKWSEKAGTRNLISAFLTCTEIYQYWSREFPFSKIALKAEN